MTYLLQKLINQRNRRRTIYVVVAIHHNHLLVGNGTLDALHSTIHILHQEGVVKVTQLRVKEFVSLFYGVYASLHK